MRSLDWINGGLPPVLNLTETSTEEAMALAMLCESVKIRVVNLTAPGIVYIPVRFVYGE